MLAFLTNPPVPYDLCVSISLSDCEIFGNHRITFVSSSSVDSPDLPEVGSRLEGGEHGLPVRVDDLQPAPGADVHLLTDLAWRREHGTL